MFTQTTTSMKSFVECMKLEDTYDTIFKSPIAHLAASMHRQQVLVVEDVPSDIHIAIEMIEDGLPDFSWEFHAIGKVKDMSILLNNYQFSVVLLDLTLEDMAGADVVDLISMRYPHLPIVVMTGCKDPAVLDQVMSKNVTAILDKDGMSPLVMRMTMLQALGEMERS